MRTIIRKYGHHIGNIITSSKKSTKITSRCASASANSAVPKHKNITIRSLAARKRRNKKITVCTAYDYPSALHVDRAGIDVLLVGDSVAMVELGMKTTQPITMNEMLHHCLAVSRATSRPLLIGDMPLGSYEINPEIALENAYRFLKETNMDAVKLEGGKRHAATISKLTQSGVAVMGHVGLLPQSISALGGFISQGKTADNARSILEDALRIQDAGAFSVLMECIPPNVAEMITEELEIPTIGIGSGVGCDGQVLVYHDLLGMTSHPHHEEFCPKFCKRYSEVGTVVSKALEEYRDDVIMGTFPSTEYTPYKMEEGEEGKFQEMVQILRERRKTDDTKPRNEEDGEIEGIYGNATNQGQHTKR